jgi:tellurium resistance protein TerD
MSPAELAKGANTTLGSLSELGGLVVGVSWQSGQLDCDVCAIICGPERKVVDDEHFLFWDHVQSPDRAISLRWQDEPVDPSRDRAQVLLALADLAPPAERIVVTLSTIIEDASLVGVTDIVVRVLDPASGQELARFAMARTEGPEACLQLVEVYQHQGSWKVRAIGQGYQTGLRGLGSDFGVNII